MSNNTSIDQQLVLPFPHDSQILAEISGLELENERLLAENGDLKMQLVVREKKIRRIAALLDRLWEELQSTKSGTFP